MDALLGEWWIKSVTPSSSARSIAPKLSHSRRRNLQGGDLGRQSTCTLASEAPDLFVFVFVVLCIFPQASIHIPIGQIKPAQSKSAEKVLPVLSVDFSLSALRHHTSIVDFCNKGLCSVKGHRACCPGQPAICLRMKACEVCSMSCDGCPVLQ